MAAPSLPPPNQDPYAFWNLLARIISAVGTLIVAALAVWGGLIKSWLVPPRLRLSIAVPRGTLGGFNSGDRVITYHLRVSNSRPWVPGNNCRVMLREAHRRGSDQQFHPVPLAVPLQFVWAPAGPPVSVTVSSEQTIDFAFLAEREFHVKPQLYVVPNGFQGLVGKNECVRFHLQISADGYFTRESQVFEVAWNGEWSDNLDVMSNNLRVREVPPHELVAAVGTAA